MPPLALRCGAQFEQFSKTFSRANVFLMRGASVFCAARRQLPFSCSRGSNILVSKLLQVEVVYGYTGW